MSNPSLLSLRSSVVRSFGVAGTAPLLLASAGAAFAADMASTDVERVVVSANRIEQPLARVGDSVTVIEADEVRRSQKTAVSDLLATTPGVSFSRNGGLGSTTALRIRGAETDQTVVLIDGVKLNDPSSTGGGFNFGDLLTSDFARIEVLRGPQSTLWGSQAIGGVVNIVTSIPEGPLSGAFAAEGGARDTAFLHARAEAGGERVAWRLAGSYLTTDGISAFDEDLGGAEKDGYYNAGFNGRVLVRITDTISAELRAMWNKGRNEFDRSRSVPPYDLIDGDEYGYTEQWLTYAGINADSFGGRLKNRLGFAYTDTDRQNYNPRSSVPLTFDATGRTERWEYQGTLTLTDAVGAVFGLESERSKMITAAPTMGNPNPTPIAHDVQLDSAYGQLSVSPIEALTLTAGLRYDDHETFGNATTGRASLAWFATPTTIVRASYGEGFKAPTLYQLFSEYGNESLAPEQSAGWDAGIEQQLFDETLVVSATYFNRDTTNMIDFVSCFTNDDPRCASRPFGGFYDNVQKTTADGVELALTARLGERLRVTANYTTVDAKNDVRGSANFGRTLPRRPDETANADITYYWPLGLTTTVAVMHAGKSFDDASNTIELDSYTVVDFRAALTIRDTWEVFARLENAFDEKYSTAARYGSIGRGAFVGVRQSF
jgi:vitamin B12 transporter